MVTDCGLLVLPTFVEAKLNDGACDRLILITSLPLAPATATKTLPAASTVAPYDTIPAITVVWQLMLAQPAGTSTTSPGPPESVTKTSPAASTATLSGADHPPPTVIWQPLLVQPAGTSTTSLRPKSA